MTYEPKYFGMKCCVVGCNKPAEYEGGDARCHCGVCEKHAGIYEQWQAFLFIEREKQQKMLKPFPKIID